MATLNCRKQASCVHNVVITPKPCVMRDWHYVGGRTMNKREVEYEIESETAPVDNWSRGIARITRDGGFLCAASLHCSPSHCARCRVRAEQCVRLQRGEPGDIQRPLVRNTPQLGRMPRSARKPAALSSLMRYSVVR